jgi:transposase
LLRGLRPRDRRPDPSSAVDLVAEIRHLDRRIAARDSDIAAAVAETGCTLVELRGVGTVLAAKVLSRVGDVHRFRSAAAFATFNGTAPLEVSSGGTVRHRLSRAGDRELNCCLHIMAITQLRYDCDGRRYYVRKTRGGQESQGSPALSEEAAVRPGLPFQRGDRPAARPPARSAAPPRA